MIGSLSFNVKFQPTIRFVLELSNHLVRILKSANFRPENYFVWIQKRKGKKKSLLCSFLRFLIRDLFAIFDWPITGPISSGKKKGQVKFQLWKNWNRNRDGKKFVLTTTNTRISGREKERNFINKWIPELFQQCQSPILFGKKENNWNKYNCN